MKHINMKYLKGYKLYESTITKSELVDKIKWYSEYLHQYMKDVNKFTTSNLNLAFSYDTELNISQIFDTTDKLEHNSPDGFITAISNEFITWSDYIIRGNYKLIDKLNTFQINTDYNEYTDEYKAENKYLYKQENYTLIYIAVGHKIKQLISGTIWDIPDKKKFTDDDNEFIIDSIISDLEVDDEYLKPISDTMKLYHDEQNVFKFRYRSTKRGIIFKIPNIRRQVVSYGSDFTNRLQYYFSGALILDGGVYGNDIRIYLPFYE